MPEEELAAMLTQPPGVGDAVADQVRHRPDRSRCASGHTVPLRKMRQFQELGHQAVIIIGNYTAMVGDPSGRDEASMKKLSEDEVEANAQFYLSQVGKVIDIDKAEASQWRLVRQHVIRGRPQPVRQGNGGPATHS
ncbi:MAG: hypothetical protein R3B91_19835 [Planctomycetaceae bacterium]